MFAAIQLRAAQELAALLTQMPEAFDPVARNLESRKTVPEAFRELDADGDGSVTPAEILAFRADGTGAAEKLLPYIEQEMKFGLAGEDIASLQGVSLAMLSEPRLEHGPAFFHAHVNGGVSTELPAVQLPAVQLPAVQLAAFGDGSVRKGGPSFKFEEGEFLSRLMPVDPSDPDNVGWSGLFNFQAPDGSSLTGVLIGLLLPSNRAGGSSLEAIVVTQEGTGRFANAPGVGQASIEPLRWPASSTPFDMMLRTRPFLMP
jgi:hypothetical protein